MEKEQLNWWDKLVLLLSVAFFPVLFQLAGTAIIGLLVPSASDQLLFLGERLAFFAVVVLVWWLVNNFEMVAFKDLTLRKSYISIYALVSVSLIALIHVLRPEESLSTITFIVIINLFIGFEEELFYRYLLVQVLKNLWSSALVVVLGQALLFTFLGHLDGNLWANLGVRFPLGIFFYYLHAWTGRLSYSVILHCLWNLIISFS